MDYSYWAGSSQPWEAILDGCRWAENDGWHGVWVPDHFMSPASADGDPRAEEAPVLEAWTLQAAIAALVPRVRIGALVSGNTYRHPAVVAKMAVTVDHISGGRAVLGLGAGWQRNEHERYGIELGDVARRSDRLEEACELVVGLLGRHRTSFAGQHYRLEDAPMEPKPVQRRLPLLIAGRGERRTLRTVARWADEWNAWGLPDEIAKKGDVLERWCDVEGRDVADVRVTVAAMAWISDSRTGAEEYRRPLEHRGGLVGTVDELREQVAAYAEAGVSELIVPDVNVPTEQRAELFGRLRTEVFDVVG